MTPTHAIAPAIGGPPAPHDGFSSALSRALWTMPKDEFQVYELLRDAPAGVHEADLLARLKRDDPERWRSRRSVVPTLRRLRRTIEGTRFGLFDGDRYWTIAAAIKPAVRVDLGPPSDICGAVLRAIAMGDMGDGKAGA